MMHRKWSICVNEPIENNNNVHHLHHKLIPQTCVWHPIPTISIPPQYVSDVPWSNWSHRMPKLVHLHISYIPTNPSRPHHTPSSGRSYRIHCSGRTTVPVVRPRTIDVDNPRHWISGRVYHERRIGNDKFVLRCVFYLEKFKERKIKRMRFISMRITLYGIKSNQIK